MDKTKNIVKFLVSIFFISFLLLNIYVSGIDIPNIYFLIIGMLLIVSRLLFFTIVLEQINIVPIIMFMTDSFFVLFTSSWYMSDNLLTEYIFVASFISFLRLCIPFIWCYYISRSKNNKYQYIIAFIYLVVFILSSFEILTQIVSFIEILAVITYWFLVRRVK